jgi:steroid delta-isomerase-like uncharacterized protein
VGATENLATHTAWADAEDRRDLSRHAEFVHNDIVVQFMGGESVAGLDAYIAMMEQVYSGLPDFRVVLEDQFATDDRVVCRSRSRGTHTGEFMGVPASGKPIDYHGISLWEFDGGKARRGWIYLDIPTLMQQLGAA